MNRMSGAESVWIEAGKGNHQAAERAAREFHAILTLLLTDLGWGERGGPVELKSPPDVLRLLANLFKETAEFEDAEQREIKLAAADMEIERRGLLEVHDQIVEELGPADQT